MGLLDNKRALIVGVANHKSIAWGIASAMQREGAHIALTYQNDKLRSRVEKQALQLQSPIILPCDVSDDAQIQSVFERLSDDWDSLDILVHSVAYAGREQLAGEYLNSIDRQSFLTAHEISSYSFSALGKAAKPMMQDNGGAMLTLSYIGAVRAMPNYNVMGIAKASLEGSVRYMAADLGPHGIRVNAISAGPVRTLAASGISGMQKFLSHIEAVAPLRRNINIEDVGNVAVFLCSDYAAAVTGEVTYVDAGFHAIGMA